MEIDSEDGKSVGKRKHQTKDDVLYGIFAADTSSSSDSEGGGPRRRNKRNKKQELTKPLNFVSKGVVMPTEETDQNSKQQKDSALASTREANIGGFEKHSKGIGAKLLAKMGYTGGGLGKHAQGIVAPIEAKPRPKYMGMGYHDGYTEAAANVTVMLQPESLDQPIPETKPKQKIWSKKQQQRNTYVSEPLLKKQLHQGGLEKLIDMRGPEPRVLTVLESLNAQEVPMAALQHNLGLLLDLAELDVQVIEWDLRNERELVAALQKEKERLTDDAIRQGERVDMMEQVVNVLEGLGLEGQASTLSLELVKSFQSLQKRFPDEYRLCSLNTTASSLALPLLHREFQGWDPLSDPQNHLNVVSIWKDLLQGDEAFDSLYTHLFMEVVFPAVRTSSTNTWQARDPEPLLNFLDSWEQLMPHQALQSILDNIVMPKLSDAVNSWNPIQEHTAIHKWIHPWLPLLGQRLDTFYPTIRNRLESVLHAWHPSDESAFTLLSPWKPVFDSGSWERMMDRFIVPKLLAVMHEFQVNPADQKLDPFYWILTWVSVIPAHHMVRIMDVFFNKWQEVLYQWLCSKPDFQEVYNWFLGWRDLIPAELSSNAHIRARLYAGLDMMNQVAEGLDVVRPESISYLKAPEQRQLQAAKVDDAGSDVDLSLKEVIELHAQENDVLFKPKLGRTQDGHQVYGFGSISIVIDSFNQKVLAQTEDGWSLVSLEQLVKLEKDYVMRRRR